MSVTTRFRYIRPFPFCPQTFATPYFDYDYVGGLTLAQAMALWWNLEVVEMTLNATSDAGGLGPATAVCRGVLSFGNPNSVSGDFTNLDSFSSGGCALTASAGPFATVGELPAVNQPYQRVCHPYPTILGYSWQKPGGAASYMPDHATLDFFVAVDPADSTKYAVYYRFFIQAGDFTNSVVAYVNPAKGPASSSGAFVGGTFSINGHTFNYRCYYNLSISGGSMSVASASFSYP